MLALFLKIVVVVVILGLMVKALFKITTGWCNSKRCLLGKTVIITGGNTGIGYKAALDFAMRGARIILACRDEEKARKARDVIIQETGNKDIIVKLIDMSSFESVRAFARDINETEERLDILVNNAGIMAIGNKKSVDGNDLIIQVNHFSSFLLTNLLIGLLKKSQPSRVINVSSLAAKYAVRFNLDEINRFTSDPINYSNSKLCNIFFTIELARKLEGTGVTAYSLHPGFVNTEIYRYTSGVFNQIASFVYGFFGKNLEEGAQTTIYCSVAQGIEKYNGEHFSDCQRISPYKTATAVGLPRKLWELSANIVEFRPEESTI